jgi:hypothetical protein
MPRFTQENPGPRRRPSGPWRNGPIPVIGVIGGIGAGKSLAAAGFARLGAFLLDADAIGHVLLEQSPSRDRVIERFGEEILEPFGEFGVRRPINRRLLGSIVFSRPEALRDLEAILHPAMQRTFEKAIGRARGTSRPSSSTPPFSMKPAGTRFATRSSSLTPAPRSAWPGSKRVEAGMPKGSPLAKKSRVRSKRSADRPIMS